MLKKLYKHEFYSLFRLLLPVYLCLIGLAGLTRILMISKSENSIMTTFQTLSTLFYILGILFIFVFTFVIVVNRFNKNLFSHEGYLTFSLPFTATQHITCKLVCAVIAEIGTVFSLLLSVLMFTIGTEFWEQLGPQFKVIFKALVSTYDGWMIFAIVVLYSLVLFASLAQGLLMFYACMAIGQIKKNRTSASFIAYIAMYFGIQVFSSLVVTPIGNIMEGDLFKGLSEFNFALISGGSILLYELLLGAALFFITTKCMTKHLNLE